MRGSLEEEDGVKLGEAGTEKRHVKERRAGRKAEREGPGQ